MHTWYKAVCDEHREVCDVMVRSTFWLFDVTKTLLGRWEKSSLSFLERHAGCELRLIWRDDQLEAVKPHLLEVYHDVSTSSCFCPPCKHTRRGAQTSQHRE